MYLYVVNYFVLLNEFPTIEYFIPERFIQWIYFIV